MIPFITFAYLRLDYYLIETNLSIVFFLFNVKMKKTTRYVPIIRFYTSRLS